MCHRLARRSYASAWHAWAVEERATHALTLTPGFWPERSFDADASFRPELKKLFRAIAHDVFDYPRRYVQQLTSDEMPWFTGMVERTTKSGADFPHIHGYLAVPEGDDELMRGVLRCRWGQDEDDHLPAYVIEGFQRRDAPSDSIARRAVFRRAGCAPSFCLRPLHGPEWAEYCVKKADRSSGFWTTAEILN